MASGIIIGLNPVAIVVELILRVSVFEVHNTVLISSSHRWWRGSTTEREIKQRLAIKMGGFKMEV